MKKTLAWATVVLLSVFLSATVMAEPYNSKQFPSKEIIGKNYNKHYSELGRDYKFVDNFGKYQSGLNKFYVYYFYSYKGGEAKLSGVPLELIRLDTSNWLIGQM